MPAFSPLSTLSTVVFVVVTTCSAAAHAQASDASALSAVPIAALSEASVPILLSGVNLTVVAVEASANGSTWVLERASDGARCSVNLAGKVAGKASVGVGASVVVAAVTTGKVLSVAGEVVAFIPNEIGAALLHNERVTQ